MADQNEVLKAMQWISSPATLDAICREVTGVHQPAGSTARKGIVKLLGSLAHNGFIAPVKNKTLGFQEPLTAGYVITPEGHVFLQSGRSVKSGPRGQHTGVKRHRVDTFRAKIWKAFRFFKKATVYELIEVAGAPSSIRTAAGNVHRYMKALERAGVVRTLNCLAAGTAPTSNGFIRYALIRDLGPQTPVAGSKYVFDPNANERLSYEPIQSADKAEVA